MKANLIVKTNLMYVYFFIMCCFFIFGMQSVQEIRNT